MRLGVLAAARIAGPAVMGPARQVEGVEVTAVAARAPERARQFADEWGVAYVADSYEALVASPDVDAVYVATPAALHHRWTLAALAAGKHVLCEKPLAANAAEAREMVAAADRSGMVLMEAYHWRYHPLATRIGEVVASGMLGELVHVEGVFTLPADVIPRNDIRWDLSLGGGALMDLGCYPLQWLRFVTAAEPTVRTAAADCPVPEVDGRMVAGLEWAHGVTGRVECSMIEPPGGLRAELVARGSRATLRVVNPLAPHRGAELRVDADSGTTVERFQPTFTGTTYDHQLAAFAAAVERGVRPPTGGDDSVATMELIDSCYRAAGLAPRPSSPLSPAG